MTTKKGDPLNRTNGVKFRDDVPEENRLKFEKVKNAIMETGRLNPSDYSNVGKGPLRLKDLSKNFDYDFEWRYSTTRTDHCGEGGGMMLWRQLSTSKADSCGWTLSITMFTAITSSFFLF